jgi:hypothetical protein
MSRRFSLFLAFFLLVVGFSGHLPALADNEPEQVSLLANEEYVGTIDHKKTRYLKVTVENLDRETATGRIAFYKERIELSADRMGPVEFRTFTLENQNERQTRIWTTLNFDEFTVNVLTGRIQLTVETPLHLK